MNKPDAITAAEPPLECVVRGCLFWELAVVRHRNGTEYIVVQTPDTCRIEAGNVPAYAYKEKWYGPDNKFWIRPQTEMEDGRFELVEPGPYGSLYMTPNVI